MSRKLSAFAMQVDAAEWKAWMEKQAKTAEVAGKPFTDIAEVRINFKGRPEITMTFEELERRLYDAP